MATPSQQAPQSFDALYRDTATDLFAYVMTIVRDHQAAEDVTHGAFERAYRKYHTYSARKGSERAWLFGIARNAALDELRRRKRSATLHAEPAAPAAPAAADDEGALRRSAVRAAIAALEPRDRELIALKFYAGLSNDEIARLTGVSVSNAGTRLNRAVNRLRESCDA
jgi:RNA polymerase sigma-70 factor (ECF subfamily)